MRVNVLDVAAAMFQGGEFTPFNGLARVYSQAEFRTNLTPSIRIDIASLDGGGSGAPNPFLRFLKPTLTLSGPAGTKIIAPAGEASSSGGVWGLITLVGLTSIPYLVGVGVGRRSRRR